MTTCAGAGLGFVDVFDTTATCCMRLAAIGSSMRRGASRRRRATSARFQQRYPRRQFRRRHDQRVRSDRAAQFVGTLQNSSGAAFVQPGLWGIAFGNDLNAQPSNTLFFAAGPNDETDGVYGRIDMQ